MPVTNPVLMPGQRMRLLQRRTALPFVHAVMQAICERPAARSGLIRDIVKYYRLVDP